MRPRAALAMRQQLTTAAGKTRPRKRPYQGNNPARRATRAGCEAAGRCTAPIAAIRLRMSVHRACIGKRHRAGGARGWRGNAAIGLAPRRRMSGRREPMPEDSGAGNRKIIASVTATQQGSARLAVRALRCRQRVQSMVSACGDASWRNWNLPLSLKSQSSNSSSCPRPFSSLPGGSGNGAARRKVASAVLSASSSPLLR